MSKNRVELSLASIQHLGEGKAHVAFGLELKRALQDCLNRPDNKQARTVALELQLKPIVEDGDCEGIEAAFDIKSRIPPRRTNPYRLGVTNSGQAWFEESEEEAAK